MFLKPDWVYFNFSFYLLWNSFEKISINQFLWEWWYSKRRSLIHHLTSHYWSIDKFENTNRCRIKFYIEWYFRTCWLINNRFLTVDYWSLSWAVDQDIKTIGRWCHLVGMSCFLKFKSLDIEIFYCVYVFFVTIKRINKTQIIQNL